MGAWRLAGEKLGKGKCNIKTQAGICPLLELFSNNPTVDS